MAIDRLADRLRELPNKSLLNPDEVASVLRISTRTVRRLRDEGEIEGVRIGGRALKFFRDSVVAYLRRQLKKD
jgi:excisionase family DNA binding protein